MRWSKNDIIFLKENYPENGISYCASNLNRTNISIERKAKRLKIFKKSPNLSWTKKDINFLSENYPVYGTRYCSNKLNRTEVSIICKANELKIFIIKNYPTKEECTIVCNKYDKYSEFYKKERYIYGYIFKMGWLNDLTNHMIRIKNKPTHWNKFDCINESLKYVTIKEWIIGSRSSYRAAHVNNWFKECSSHMVKLGSRQLRLIYSFEFNDNSVYVGLTHSPEIRKKWHLFNEKSPIYKHIKKTKEFPKFKILTDYLDKNIASIKEGDILNQYISSGWTTLNKNKTGGLGGNHLIWDEDNCINEAKKYKTRREFSIKNNSAYGSARRNGWLNDCCSHMGITNNNHKDER